VYFCRNLVELLETAEESIDICLLLLNLENVADVFLQALYKGIKVRMITDAHMANLSGSQVSSLIEEGQKMPSTSFSQLKTDAPVFNPSVVSGVAVRGMHYHTNMHHKFIILDNKLVFFGSFNWSMQALCGNCENLVCTNNSSLVDKFKIQFSDMWTEFKPIEVEKIGLRRF